LDSIASKPLSSTWYGEAVVGVRFQQAERGQLDRYGDERADSDEEFSGEPQSESCIGVKSPR